MAIKMMSASVCVSLVLTVFVLCLSQSWALSLRDGDNLRMFTHLNAIQDIVQEPEPFPLGDEPLSGTRARRVVRQAAATTAKPAVTTAKPAATTAKPATTNATTIQPSTTPLPPAVNVTVPNVNVSSINYRNYSLVDHTSFDNGQNGWTLVGVWAQMDLNKTASSLRPVPLLVNGTLPQKRSLVEGGGNVGAAGSSGSKGENPDKEIQRQQRAAATPSKNLTVLAPDQNNFVVVNYVNGIVGQLRKKFLAFVRGEVIVRYFTLVPDTSFVVGIETGDNTTAVIYNSTVDGKNATVGAWTSRRFNFTSQQTLNTNFTLTLTIKAPASAKAGAPLLAVQHIAVGGNYSAGVKPPIVVPTSTVSPPGSLPYLAKISSGIWTALYVFLAFFILCIIAIVVLVVRGRNRQRATPATPTDYDPNTSYRLDKVYDNPSYDASTP